jgi:hypothetical protein
LKAQKVEKYQFFGTKNLSLLALKKIFFKGGVHSFFGRQGGGVQTKNMGKKIGTF